MFRRLIAAAVSLAVVAAVCGAPLVHAHVAEHDGAVITIHAHFGAHAGAPADPGTPRVDHADDERAIFLPGPVSAAPPAVAPLATAADVFILAPPHERAAEQRLRVVRGHDPPVRLPGPPRAPPACLS